MSGRWRSRHWRPEDEQHRGGGGGNIITEGSQNYDSTPRNSYGRSSSWNNGAGGGNNYYNDRHEYDHGQFYRRDDTGSYHDQQQQYYQQQPPHHHDPRYNDNRRPQQQQYGGNYNSNYNNEASGDRRAGRWQRGQTPAHRHHDQHDMRSGGNGGRLNNSNSSSHNNRPAPSSKRNVSSGSTWNNAKNPPTNAWGKEPPSSAASKLGGADIKVENQSSTMNEHEAKKRMAAKSSVNNNVWKKSNPSSSSSASAAANASVKAEFPPLSSQHEAMSSNSVDVKVEMVQEEGTKRNIIDTSSSSTLPTNSAWGKTHSSLGWAAKQPPPPSEVKKKKQHQQGNRPEDFPSLSASLNAPRKQPPPQGLMTTTDTPMKSDATTKKGGSNNKKSAASTTNLASFLIREPKKGNTTTNKKHPPSKPVKNKVNNSHGDHKKKHPREDTQHHPAIMTSTSNNNNNNSANGITTGAPPIKKGRQRLAPRKKKLTTLKKRVLEERLRIWKEQNGEAANAKLAGDAGGNEMDMHSQVQNKFGSSAEKEERSTTLLVDNFVNPEEDDLNDDDEHDELVTNLINLAGRVGRVVSVYIPRPSSDDEESNLVGLSFVRLATYQDAHAARDILDGMVVGGQKLSTKILWSIELEVCDVEFPANLPSEENERQWRLGLLKAIVANQTSLNLQGSASRREDGGGSTGLQQLSLDNTIVFYNILSSDDYEDEDALEESIEDIQSIAAQYGRVVNARGDDAGNVYVTYDTSDVAAFAAQKLDGMLLGGVPIAVSLNDGMATNRTPQTESSTVVLDNVLSEDDFEDEDCLNESIEDIRSLAEKYGIVGSLIVDTSKEEEKGKIHVEYTGGLAVAREAATQLNGMMFGGRLISAALLTSGTSDTNIDNNNAANPVKDGTKIEQEPPQPMFSGDKVIPERFAQCKRVPKVANSGTPRAYASKIADPGAIPLLTEMLGELMRLQQRSRDQKNARSRRRLVMGLREVARGIRAHKVKMVVMANNLDEYGAIDSKLQEILDLADAEDVPVIFELNKRKLGKAVGKSIKVSVVGIQNVMGAEQQFKQLKRMAGIT